MNSNFRLQILDIFPVQTREPDQRTILLAESRGQVVTPSVIYEDPITLLKEIIDPTGNAAASSALEDALRASCIYGVWKKSMPALKTVKNIHGYRNRARHLNDIAEVNREIIEFGGYLPKGQILFRGGCFHDHNMAIDDGPISTSLMPSVALWHAREVKGAVAILRAADDTTKAFVFSSSGNQKNKLEYEVLLQNNIRIIHVGTHEHVGIKIIEFDFMAI